MAGENPEVRHQEAERQCMGSEQQPEYHGSMYSQNAEKKAENAL